MAVSAAPTRRSPASPNPWRPVALGLLGVAFVLASWLAIQSWRAQPMPGCGEGDCGAVLASKWSKFLGVPVGVLGAANYLLLAIFGARPVAYRERGPRVVAGSLLLLIPAAASWFVVVQAWVLKAFCPWCTGTHAIATAGAAALAWAWRQDRRSSATVGAVGRRPGSSPSVWVPASILATSALACLAMIQALSPEPPRPKTLSASMAPAPAAPPAPASTPPTPAVEVPPQPPTSSAAVGAEADAVETSVPSGPVTAPPGVLILHGGRFRVDPADVPVIGSPAAPHRMVMISDYTCRYCRAAHRLLHDVRESFSTNELAILMLPSQHGGESLAIQKLMLAAWRLDPAIWLLISDDLYEERMPITPAAVRGVLESRLGAERLAASMEANGRWTDGLFQLARGIYAANSEKAGSRSIPQFIVGQEIVVGAPEEVAEFYHMLSQHLGLNRTRLPELLLAASSVDVGRVFAGTLQSLRIPFSNPGQAPVQVDRATLPPGGRLGAGFRVPVAPGQTSSLEIGVPIPRDPGPFDQAVTFFSNARSSSNALRVTGTSWKPLTITPELLDFGRLDADQTSTQGVLRIELAEPVVLDSVRSENPGFSAQLHERVVGKEYEIEVSTSPQLAVGRQQAMLLVELRKPVPAGWPDRLAVAARAVVDRAVTAVPPRILIPPGPLSADRHHQVLVRCTENASEFGVSAAVLEGGPAFTQPQIVRGAKAGEFIVQVTLPAGWAVPPGPAGCHLVIHTSHPRYPRLEVPLVTQSQGP